MRQGRSAYKEPKEGLFPWKKALLGLFVCASLLFLPSYPLYAQDLDQKNAPPQGLEVTTVAEASAGPIDDAWFTTLTARLGLRLGVAALASESGRSGEETTLEALLEAPMRLHLEGEEAGSLRRKDWDEASDVARIVRRLAYGQRHEAVWVRLSELAAISLNGGTIVWNHFNTISPNVRRLGASAQLRVEVAEAAILIDDLLSPDLVATSLAARPAKWFESTEDSALGRIRIAAEAAWDLDAPAGPQTPEKRVRTAIWGSRLSLDLPAWKDLWRWQAYAHWNWHDGIGDGLHVGGDLQATLSERWLAFSLQGEWIRSEGGYIPRYFGPLYALERTLVRGFGSQDSGKLWAASTLETPGRQVFGSLGVHLPLAKTQLTMALGHEWQRPQADTFLLALHTGPVWRLGASFFLTRSGLDRAWQPWGGVASTLAGAEGRFWLLDDTVYAMGRWGKQWDVEAKEALDLWEVGVGVQWALGLQ